MMVSVSLAEPGAQVQDHLPQPGRYRHFKGGEYELLGVGRHSETEELFAVYRAAADPETVWVRPLKMFLEPIERPGGVVPRFQPAPNGSRAPARFLVRAAARIVSQIPLLPSYPPTPRGHS